MMIKKNNFRAKRIVEDVKIEGFYGIIPSEEVTKVISKTQNGNYLLRVSSTLGCWAVSFVEGGKIEKLIIDHLPFSNLYSFFPDKQAQKPLRFNSLSLAVDYIKKQFNLNDQVFFCPPNKLIFSRLNHNVCYKNFRDSSN